MKKNKQCTIMYLSAASQCYPFENIILDDMEKYRGAGILFTYWNVHRKNKTEMRRFKRLLRGERTVKNEDK